MLIFDPSMREVKPSAPWYRVMLSCVRSWVARLMLRNH
jgi:hypothetical protein